MRSLLHKMQHTDRARNFQSFPLVVFGSRGTQREGLAALPALTGRQLLCSSVPNWSKSHFFNLIVILAHTPNQGGARKEGVGFSFREAVRERTVKEKKNKKHFKSRICEDITFADSGASEVALRHPGLLSSVQ